MAGKVESHKDEEEQIIEGKVIESSEMEDDPDGSKADKKELEPNGDDDDLTGDNDDDLPKGKEDDGDGDDDDDDVVITIGDEEPPESEDKGAPDWVKELRRTNRELAKKNRELEKKLSSDKQETAEVVDPGPRPKLIDYDYDTDAYEAALDEWHVKKRNADDLKTRKQSEEEEQTIAWQNRLKVYADEKRDLKVKDFEDVEATVLDTLNVTQQGIIVQGAKNPATVIYALGKHPEKLKELAKIIDPVKFAFTVANLEREMKVGTRKKTPPPERKVEEGTASKSGSVDSTLERLRDEAAKTGNYSKVHDYKQKLKSRQK